MNPKEGYMKISVTYMYIHVYIHNPDSLGNAILACTYMYPYGP